MTSLELWPIGNCQVSGLIDETGSIVWGCVPRVDGDPTFCALLRGEDGHELGTWRFMLEGQCKVEQEYLRNTPILRTRLEDELGGKVDIFDFCPRFERLGRMFRPVAFARIVRPVAGSPRLRVLLTPMNGYGAAQAPITHGTNHIRYLNDRHALRLTTDAPVGYVLDERHFRVESALHFYLGPDEPFVGNVGREVEAMLQQTEAYWRLWVRGLATPLDWQQAVIRAAITLKLCQHEETGAIVAALTTSIPEAPNSRRNWDYRYCWIRDAYYTVQALNRLGALDVLEKYLAYLRNLVDDAHAGVIQPLYSVSGAREIIEWEAECLPGYRGMGPVRIGNAAYYQLQNDCYGQIIIPNIQAFSDHRLLRMANAEDFTSLEKVGEMAWQLHDQPDAGLWELRTRTAVHTYSSVMSWAACDRLANAAELLGLNDREALWRTRADAIRAHIDQQAWFAEGGHYAASFGGQELDASLLQLVELRYVHAADPRFQATLKAVEKTLRRGEHMLRYASEDDFGLPETAFNICTFWLIEALHLDGRDEEAKALFEAMLAHRTRSGLLSEDMDFETGELWGNFPQTYSLVGIINCAGLLSRSWGDWR
ncbi:glycoside hydrolase family 15 protein [Novosphingobium album (ex Liu et al. 2023)]|uniref:Glycoside hydrolase family 15 protein n=1 Tax=Novosphingobium album (ex Liu et al. 2023) TaxID=3031130 RepID=A0ABT5WJQ5_9SPHN|nr:glycoside hydrolase family 15 protein [Novosphingobium album (ex Liu et al. 2023)]MDE8650280.1 glycoside hydrolase family 15 protein [Novosphingobium album (ex Liu et al. 2023)]